MRGRMSTAKSYATPVGLGEVMVGGTVSEVVASRHPDFVAGDAVLGATGWQEYALSDGKGLRRLDPALAPLSTALGVLGMPGMTAYTGLLTIGQPKRGETLAVAAATGPVGATVGQIANIKGCRTVGIAGGERKLAAIRGALEGGWVNVLITDRFTAERLIQGVRAGVPLPELAATETSQKIH